MSNDVASPRGPRWSARLDAVVERPYVDVSMPTAVAGVLQPKWRMRIGGAILLIAGAWLARTVVTWNGDTVGPCGPVPASMSSVVRGGPSPELSAKLRAIEKSGSDARKVAARSARIQCGLLSGPDEAVESFALQLTATGIVFDPTNSSWLFAAVDEARKQDNLGADGHVDAVKVLRWAFGQPKGSMPPEFERERAAVPDVITRIEQVRSTWK